MELNKNPPAVKEEETVVEKSPSGRIIFPANQVIILAVLCILVGFASGLAVSKKLGESPADDDHTALPFPPPLPSSLPPGPLDYYDDVPVNASTGDKISFPEGSAYKFNYGNLYYTDQAGSDQYLSVDVDSFEYLNEDLVKDKDYVYYKGKAQQGVDPSKCSLNDIDECQEDDGWKDLVTPYPLQVNWSADISQAEDLLPAFAPLCLSSGYKVGEINNGFLAGYPLLVQMDEICDMWCGGRAILGAHHYVKYGEYTIPVSVANGFIIPDLATSSRTEKVTIPGSSLALIKEGTIGLAKPENTNNRSFLISDPIVGDIYRDDYACFVSERPDHVEVAYSLEFPFTFGRDNGEIPFIKPDGTTNQEVYKAYRDYNSCLNVIESTMMDETKLVKAGDFANGIELYEWADKGAEKLKELYENPNTLASYQAGQNTYTYDEFIQFKPYLYWKDPFGDFVEFLNRRFDTAAEKCKPVIYLYPEKEGRFNVQVQPNGGFTETIPEYHDGWNVIAKPDSTITDTRTGEAYPYLYWEGVNTGIPEITEGWVVKRAEVETFLNEKLALLGLTEKEITDFNEYWITRLLTEEAEQFKVMFVPQVMFDELAPLTVSGDEKPQTVIRVMMYAQVATLGDLLPEQFLPPTPIRRGFTVVEWGGALLN